MKAELRKPFTNEISVYKGELTLECVKIQSVRILAAFRKLDNTFINLLTQRLKDNNFTDKRLIDAVNFVIDNHRYPEPLISDFISYDKKIKTYTHKEACNYGMEHLQATDVGIGVCVFVKKIDFINYNLKKWKPKKS